MSEVQVTLYGYVGQDVTFKQTTGGDVASFRVGTTPRIRDGRGGFKDGETVWTSVTCWRTLAQNVKASVHTGDPVVVVGKLRTRRWVTSEGQPAERQVVEATTVCHDLAKGTSVFRKNPRNTRWDDDVDEVGGVLEETERQPVGVDPSTGEVLTAVPEPAGDEAA
ncbi:MAG: single-stranded DNA-binding protein [Actinomycetota bacterium]|nr:single-stranded DNA-binding protein [Actinomycetota bacterium]